MSYYKILLHTQVLKVTIRVKYSYYSFIVNILFCINKLILVYIAVIKNASIYCITHLIVST